MSGWIKIHRSIIDWEWYGDLNVSRLFIHCLLIANHEDKKWRGKTIEKGSFISSLGNLSQSSGLSLQSTRTAISKLQSTGELTSKGHSEYTVFTVVKYNNYQDINTQLTHESTNEQQTSNKRATTTKELKNIRNNIDRTSFDFKSALIDLGISEQIVNDFLLIRKQKKAVNSLTAFNSLKNEIIKSNRNPNECISYAVEHSWKGFKAEWISQHDLFDSQKQISFTPKTERRSR